jgi:hypothetical protein
VEAVAAATVVAAAMVWTEQVVVAVKMTTPSGRRGQHTQGQLRRRWERGRSEGKTRETVGVAMRAAEAAALAADVETAAVATAALNAAMPEQRQLLTP